MTPEFLLFAALVGLPILLVFIVVLIWVIRGDNGNNRSSDSGFADYPDDWE